MSPKEGNVKFTLNCSIRGETSSAVQLAQVEYARHLHVLHDVKRRGARVTLAGHTADLTHSAIDLLEADTAREVSVRTRSALDVDALRELFADQLRASERIWAMASDCPAGSPLRAAAADVTITGLTLDQLRAGLLRSRDREHAYESLNPDHYAMADRDGQLYVMETFGMCGGPTEMFVVTAPGMPAPVEPAPGYQVLTSGYAKSTSNGAKMEMPVFHQIKESDGGLEVKLGAFFPPLMPQPIVDGQGMHMAIEFWHLARSLAP